MTEAQTVTVTDDTKKKNSSNDEAKVIKGNSFICGNA